MTIFARCDDEKYEKLTEIHYERAYSLEEIKAALQEAGMTFVASYNAFTRQPPDKNSERIYIVAQENGKQTA